LKANKDQEKKNKILFIDASELFLKGRNQNYFLLEHASRVIEIYEEYSDKPNYSKIVDIEEIRTNEYNLNIPRYIKDERITQEIDLADTINELDNRYEQFAESEKKVKLMLKAAGIV